MMFFDLPVSPTLPPFPSQTPRWVQQGDKKGLACEYCATWCEADETSPGYRVSLRTIVCGMCRAHGR